MKPELKISIPASDIAHLQKAIDARRDVMIDRLIDAMERGGWWVMNDAKANAPVDMGELRANIGPPKVDRRNLRVDIIADKPYSRVVEVGRRPGKFPPVDVIERWAKRVIGVEGLGFVIARKIAQRGTTPQPFMRPSAQKNRDRVINEMRRSLHVR